MDVVKPHLDYRGHVKSRLLWHCVRPVPGLTRSLTELFLRHGVCAAEITLAFTAPGKNLINDLGWLNCSCRENPQQVKSVRGRSSLNHRGSVLPATLNHHWVWSWGFKAKHWHVVLNIWRPSLHSTNTELLRVETWTGSLCEASLSVDSESQESTCHHISFKPEEVSVFSSSTCRFYFLLPLLFLINVDKEQLTE